MDALSLPFRQAGSPYDRAILALLVMFLLCSAFSIALTQIGYFSALTLWIGRMAYRRKWTLPSSPFDKYFLAYAVAEILATVFAADKLYSLLYLQRRLLIIPIIFVLLANITTPAQLRMLFTALVTSAVGVALWSLRTVIVHFADFLQFHRRLGEFQIYMTAGGIQMIALLLILPFIIHRNTPRKVRITAGIAVLPLLCNLFFTFTRSSWLGFITGVIIIGSLRSRKILFALIALIVVVFLLSTPEMRERRMYSLVEPYHPDNISRLHMWTTGLRAFADHPLFGVGDVGMETIWSTYANPDWGTEGHLHNNIIMWLVTLGVVGCSVLVALFVKIWVVFWRAQKALREEWFAGSLALGGLAVLGGFHVNGLFEWNFGDAEIIMLVWAVVGLLLAALKIASANTPALAPGAARTT